MNPSGDTSAAAEEVGRTNGSGAAAILSAAIGSFALSILALVTDRSATMKSDLAFYKPTGPLSGVTDLALAVWLLLWVVLEIRWKNKNVTLRHLIVASFVLLGLSFLLTFPPIADMF